MEGPKKVSMQEDTAPVVMDYGGPTNRFHGANLPEVDEEGKEKPSSEIQPPLNKVENYKWVPIV